MLQTASYVVVLTWYDPAVGKVTRNCAVKKSLCGAARLSRVSGESAAADCGFSDPAEVDADAADLAAVRSVDCSERWTALTARADDDDARDELVITPNI